MVKFSDIEAVKLLQRLAGYTDEQSLQPALDRRIRPDIAGYTNSTIDHLLVKGTTPLSGDVIDNGLWVSIRTRATFESLRTSSWSAATTSRSGVEFRFKESFEKYSAKFIDLAQRAPGWKSFWRLDAHVSSLEVSWPLDRNDR